MSGGDRPARPEDVDAICAALPETELGVSWGTAVTWKVPRGPKGRGFLLRREPRGDAIDPATDEPFDDLIVIPVADLGIKQALVEAQGPFFSIEHFRSRAAVLISEARLGELGVDELREVITEAWQLRAPRRLITKHQGDPRG